MEKCKDESTLSALLARYGDSFHNDYLNRDRYRAHLDELYYIENGDLYILLPRDGYYETYFYLVAQNPLAVPQKLVTEVVGREPEIGPLLAVGFRPYARRIRLRLRAGAGRASARVEELEDFDFVRAAISSFDPLSGHIHTDAEIRRDIKEGRIIGIPGEGLLQYSVSKTEQTIEHLYVAPAARGRGVAKEILGHYVAARQQKRRSTVWTGKDHFAARLYESLGFRRDGLESAVLTN